MAPLSAVSESLQGVTHVRRISEYSGEPGKVAADAEALAANFRQYLEHRFVGDIVADEDGNTACKRRMSHQLANAVAFVDARPLDLEHCLAQQQFGWLVGKCGAAGGDVPAQAFCQLRRFPVMQRE